MAPEYLDRGIITKELDIFSLDVIIIQVVTGQKHYPYRDDKTSSKEFIKLVTKLYMFQLSLLLTPFPERSYYIFLPLHSRTNILDL
jgi:hypothetical protein